MLVMWYIFNSYLYYAIWIFISLSILNFFPIYTLIKRKVIPYGIFILTLLTNVAITFFLAQILF